MDPSRLSPTRISSMDGPFLSQSSPLNMPSLLMNAALTGFAFALFAVGRFLFRLISARISLRHVPGPSSSSFLWGEEWNLYHNTPGSHYLEWHQQFGKVLKFRGACGVLSPLSLSKYILLNATVTAPSTLDNR